MRGGPFDQYKLLYPKPMVSFTLFIFNDSLQCKFGHDDMVVEATYVLCTSHKHTIDEKEAHHRDMVSIFESRVKFELGNYLLAM